MKPAPLTLENFLLRPDVLAANKHEEKTILRTLSRAGMINYLRADIFYFTDFSGCENEDLAHLMVLCENIKRFYALTINTYPKNT